MGKRSQVVRSNNRTQGCTKPFEMPTINLFPDNDHMTLSISGLKGVPDDCRKEMLTYLKSVESAIQEICGRHQR